MERYLDASDPAKIARHALNALGLDYAYLKKRAALPHAEIAHLNQRSLSINHWIRICDALYMPIRALSEGYNSREHKARIRYYWERGLLDVPATRLLKRLIAEIREDRRRERRFLRTRYGRGLRFRIFYRTLMPSLLNFLIRSYNQSLIRLQRRRVFSDVSRFFILSSFDPDGIPRRNDKSHRPKLVVVPHGLTRTLSVIRSIADDAAGTKDRG